MAKVQKTDPADAYEQMVDEAIAACEGDERAAIKALLVINEILERELDALAAQVSNGYTRGQMATRKAGSRPHCIQHECGSSWVPIAERKRRTCFTCS